VAVGRTEQSSRRVTAAELDGKLTVPNGPLAQLPVTLSVALCDRRVGSAAMPSLPWLPELGPVRGD